MCFRASDNSFEVSWVNLGRRFPAFVVIDRRGRYEKTSQTARLVDSPLTCSPPQPRRTSRLTYLAKVEMTIISAKYGQRSRGGSTSTNGLSRATQAGDCTLTAHLICIVCDGIMCCGNPRNLVKQGTSSLFSPIAQLVERAAVNRLPHTVTDR